MSNRLAELDVTRVDIVDRAAVRDPNDTAQPAKFLLWKSEQSAITPKENSMKTDGSRKLAEALSKAADNEAALDTFIAKEEVTPEMAAAVKGAFRLLSTAKAAMDADAMIELGKALGIEIEKAKPAFPGAAAPFGAEGEDAPKPHAFEPKEAADGSCKACGLGGTAAVHAADSAGASGSKTVEAAEKSEESEASESEPSEEILKSELAKLPEPIRATVEKAIATAKAEKERADAAEEVAKSEREALAKSEIRQMVKDEMSHVPGTTEEALVELLNDLKKSDAAKYDLLRPILASASEGVAKSELLKSAGSAAAGGAGDPNAVATEIAKGIAKAEGISMGKAKAEAWKRNPELHRQYMAAQAAV